MFRWLECANIMLSTQSRSLFRDVMGTYFGTCFPARALQYRFVCTPGLFSHCAQQPREVKATTFTIRILRNLSPWGRPARSPFPRQELMALDLDIGSTRSGNPNLDRRPPRRTQSGVKTIHSTNERARENENRKKQNGVDRV
ncbi:hypothetical protein BO82DRAFT_21132 [Aspergillus uvarum CBS 121591]|uniref:Uncharacterized protein n=1 Tax=Aspergillus uvarum CBS 121591 TaxID=1448315 RepID=A0A319BS68_9EURO|nr:hypothetical protein BO82DRAFT_21132 [Aspergillus uvarum CBS 121591]PYH75525.1 hypothetical protein BO82DRAFT_21132 [Aspergillus uvarum CBS 121591]